MPTAKHHKSKTGRKQKKNPPPLFFSLRRRFCSAYLFLSGFPAIALIFWLFAQHYTFVYAQLAYAAWCLIALYFNNLRLLALLFLAGIVAMLSWRGEFAANDAILCPQPGQVSAVFVQNSGDRVYLAEVREDCQPNLSFDRAILRPAGAEKLEQRLRYIQPGVPIELKNVLLEKRADGRVSITPFTSSRVFDRKQSLEAAEAAPIRNNLIKKADYYLDPSAKELFVSLALAQRWILTKQTRAMLQDLGIFHLFAISGLHVGILYFWFALGLRYALSPLPIHRLGIAIRPGCSLLALFGVYAYLEMIGMPITAQRAWIMLTIYIVCSYWLWWFPNLVVLLLTAAGMLVYEPLILGSISFQLSFIAVLAVFCALPVCFGLGQRPWHQKIALGTANMLMITSFIITFSAPLQILYFQSFIPLSPINNLFHVLFATFVFVPFALLVIGIDLLPGIELSFLEIIIFELANTIGTFWSLVIAWHHAWLGQYTLKADWAQNAAPATIFCMVIAYWTALGVLIWKFVPRRGGVGSTA